MLSFPLIWSKSVLWRKMAFLPGNVFLAWHRIIINVIPQRFHTTLNKYWPNKLERWAKSLLSDLQFTMKISWTSLYWNGIIATLQLYKERKQTKTSVHPRKTLGSQKKKHSGSFDKNFSKMWITFCSNVIFMQVYTKSIFIFMPLKTNFNSKYLSITCEWAKL